MSPNNLRAPLVFDGTGDVRLFFYRYERSVGKELNEIERAETLIDHLEGEPLEFYCKKFLTNYSEYSKKPYPKVKAAITAKYQPEQRAAELASAAVELKYTGGDIKEFLEHADQLYTEAKFSPEASYGLLKRAIRDTSFPSHLFSGPTAKDYDSLSKEILRVHEHVREYGIGTSTLAQVNMMEPAAPITVPQPESPAKPTYQRSPKGGTNKLADDETPDMSEIIKRLDSLTLLVTKGQEGQGPKTTRPCGYCNEIGHIMSHCTKNPYRNKYCGYCGRLGHMVAQCYSYKRSGHTGGFRPGQGNAQQQAPAPQANPQAENTAAVVVTTPTPQYPNETAMLISTVNGGTPAPAVNAVKRAHDGEPVRKQLRPRPEGRVEDIRRPVNVPPLPQPVQPPARTATQPTLGYRAPAPTPLPPVTNLLPPEKQPTKANKTRKTKSKD